MTTVDTLRDQLRLQGLDTRGHKQVLKARLRKHLKQNPENNSILAAAGTLALENHGNSKDFDGSDVEEGSVEGHIQCEKDTTVQSESPRQKHRQEESKANTVRQQSLHKNSQYDYYLCFDVEATCEEGYSFEFPNEVIEFPVVMLDGSTLEVVDEFHSYVRPTHRTKLSDFCKDLTGISQDTIDAAPTFTEVLALFEDWLSTHGIIIREVDAGSHNDGPNEKSNAKSKQKKSKRSKRGGGSKSSGPGHNPLYLQLTPAAVNDFSYGASFCFVTDGPFDIRDFISKQCIHSQIPRPSYFVQSYIDVRTLFRDYFDLIQWRNLEGMLSFLGETFLGRQHSGICDARMVALIAKRLAEGFSKNENNPVFEESKMGLVAPQWDEVKMGKLKSGCVLKANRSTEQTYVKMLSFRRLDTLESLSTIAALPMDGSAKSSGSPSVKPAKVESPNLTIETLLPTRLSPLSSPLNSSASSSSSSSPVASFVTSSMFSALMSEPEDDVPL